MFCWEEDFSQANLYSVDEDDDENEVSDENENTDDEEQPSWSVLVSYSNGEKQQMKGFDIPLRINELALDLLQYFEDDDDMDFDDETYF